MCSICVILNLFETNCYMKNKKSFIFFLLYLIGLFSTAAAHNGTLEYGEQALKGFYFNPLEFVAEPVETNSLIKVTYSSHQYLLAALVKKPLDWPIKSTKPVQINGRVFYLQHRQEAGMCHLYDYYMYCLQENGRYYVFVFLFTADCFAKTLTAHEEAARFKEMEKILASPKFPD